MLVAHDALVGGLSTAERDTFVREWDAVGRLMGLSPEPDAGRTPRRCAGTSIRRCGAARPFPAPARWRWRRPSCTRRSAHRCSVRAWTRSPSSRPGLLPSELRRGYGLQLDAGPRRGVRCADTFAASGDARECRAGCASRRSTTWPWRAPRAAGRLPGPPDRTGDLTQQDDFPANDGRCLDESLLYELRPGQSDATWTYVVTRRHT